MKEEIIPKRNEAVPDIKDAAPIDQQDPRIRKKFPLGDRFKEAVNCFAPANNGVNMILNQPNLFTFEEMYPD